MLRAFERHGVEYGIFGAVAMNLHGIVSATEDIDVMIAADAGNIERLKRALHRLKDKADAEMLRRRFGQEVG